MKTLILISTMALGLMSVGCSKSNSGATANNNNTAQGTPGPILVDPNPPGGSGSGSGATSAGSTVDLKVANLQALKDWVLPGSPYEALNNPTNVKVTFNLSQSSAGRYGGTVTISYTDNGKTHSGTLKAGSGTNMQVAGAYDNGRLEADYNYWFTFENQLVFTGFFEDDFGAITLTLTPDEPVGGGNDAEPLKNPYKGTIHFKNFRNKTTGEFRQKINMDDNRACWFNYTGGVFDCRSNVIQTKCGLAPGIEAGYTELGTFTNVDIKQAFNIN